MELFFDLDCLAKLSACAALDDVFELYPSEQKYYVDTFPHTAEKLALKQNQSQLAEVYRKIANRSLLAGFTALKTTPDDAETLDGLQQIPDIDVGEAILLLSASRVPEPCLLTGDKRFLTAVWNHRTQIESMIPLANIRFRYFLNLLHEVCQHTPAKIKNCQTPCALACDRAIQAVFSGTPSMESLADAVISYSRPFAGLLQ